MLGISDCARPQETDVRYVFLVGGFAESKALQHRVKNELETGGRRVIVPLRPGLAVLRGAVMLGLGALERFASRLARRTYGVAVATPFNPRDPDHARRQTVRVVHEGREMTEVCGSFSRIVARGTRVALGQVHRGGCVVIVDNGSGETGYCFNLFAAEDNGTKWVTDPGVERIGHVCFSARPGEVVRVDLCFGASELRAAVVNQTTGATTPATIQYGFCRDGSGARVAAGGGGQGEPGDIDCCKGWSDSETRGWRESTKLGRKGRGRARLLAPSCALKPRPLHEAGPTRLRANRGWRLK